ncbi:hypothetical protein [Paenibacillus hexagrammi]|uniref:Uncharacterized protein n=1 Tax=Paenibacillus hexagrammi TaxID=2908839 RepID=A0ABY3SFW4_9BACL|nr:hypothetical protein [Paenibacillus sp. YPD9-1]UJF32091.1 hypothetical protein L0M14_20485 [Paenibacillus sp. YPD9-1]
MSLHDREQWIKLDLLNSLALSQRALARIIESVAECVEASPPLAKQVAENLDVIVHHQQVLTRRITGIHIRERQKGTPGKPWINRQPGVQGTSVPPSH